jgi:hypothetical protein
MLYIFDKALTSFVVLKDDKQYQASAYCGGLILKQTDIKHNAMVFRTPTNSRTN